jgi:hypothetical protein
MTDTLADIVLTREELYDRVWSTPMQKLASEFGLSDVGLAKVCKRHNIPRPSRGYWAKLECGKKVHKFPLFQAKDASLSRIHFRRTSAREEPKEEPPLAIHPDIAALISAELDPANKIEVPLDLRGANPIIAATRESLSKGTADEYGRVSRRYDFKYPCFDVSVAKHNVHRALLLLHGLVRAFQDRGFTIVSSDRDSSQPHIQVLERKFRISVWEPSKRQKRELTKDETQQKERYPWSSIRDYEYVPTGVLELHLDRDTYSSSGRFADTKRVRLEDRLNDVIICMLRNVDHGRVAAERARLEAIEKQKRKTAAVQLEVIHRADEVRQKRLLKAIPVWEDSRRIRAYVEAVRAATQRRYGAIEDASEMGQWLKWAEEYLDSIDPFSDRRDLPTYSLTSNELDQLTRECEADWSDYSEMFRPRNPR